MTDAQGTGTPTTTPGEQPPSTGAESSPTTNATPSTPEGDAAPTTPPQTQDTELDIKFDLPEGVTFDEKGAADFKALAKELNLAPDAAKKIADLAASRARAQFEQNRQLIDGWAEQVKADKEIGGDKLTENLAIAKKAVDTFGSPALRELLEATGLGNHPEVVKAFLKAGKAISEDGFVRGAPKAPTTESDLAKSLFPTMK